MNKANRSVIMKYSESFQVKTKQKENNAQIIVRNEIGNLGIFIVILQNSKILK